jgi:type IV pilus assembly protein PilA
MLPIDAVMAHLVGSRRTPFGRVASEAGFTLLELLVVALILGILAAIAIPSFFNQTDKAQDAEAKYEARVARGAIEVYRTENDGSYEDASIDDLVDIESTLSDVSAEGRLSVSSEANSYTIEVDSRSDPATQHFRIERAGGGATLFTCDVPGTDGCPADGNWGN